MIFIQRCILMFIAICWLFQPCEGIFSRDFYTERLNVLKNKGFRPRVVYDIGAHKGAWTMEVLKIFNQAQFLLFEANECHESYLQCLGFPYFFAVLGDREEFVTFYANNSTGDSIFREQTRFYKDGNCSENRVKMTTLDALAQKYELPLPDLVKIDVQGAEKLIIKGGSSIICNAEVVILETKILEYNQKAPLIYEIMTLMYELGYCVLDFLELHYLPTHELSEVDILFVKNDSSLVKRGMLW